MKFFDNVRETVKDDLQQTTRKDNVLMLSATLVNKRFNNVKNQIQLAYEGEVDKINRELYSTNTEDRATTQST